MPSIPSLIGGLVIAGDLVPSIVFAILYGSLALLGLFRLARSSRTALLGIPVFLAAERTFVFSTRAAQSLSEAKAVMPAKIAYQQLTLGVGFANIAHSLGSFLRVLLVNSTKQETNNGSIVDQSHDQPRRRFWYRRLTDFMNMWFMAAVFPGTRVGADYLKVLLVPGSINPSAIMLFRYVSCAVGFLLVATIGVTTLVALLKIPRIPKSAAYIVLLGCFFISMEAVYRLVAMQNTVDSLLSRDRGSLNSPTAKAMFYLLHVMPEWLALLTLLAPNNRRIFNTGPFGDWRLSDPKKKQETRNEGESVNSLESKATDQQFVEGV